MKNLILLPILLFALSVSAQKKSDLMANSKFQIGTYDNSKQVFQLSFTGDTSLLKPLGTIYSAKDNTAFMEVRYLYKEGKRQMQLTIKSYYMGSYWSFRSCEIEPYQMTSFLPILNTYPNIKLTY